MHKVSHHIKPATVLGFVVCFFIICLIVNPQKYVQSVYNGLLLFANTVAPALFPFFFFTKLLTGLGFADYLAKIGGKPIQKMYNCPKSAAYVFIMSIMSGYPVGSKLVCDLYSNHQITTQEAKRICSFTSTSGPLFVVGTIGALMFKSALCGYICFFCHIFASLINGFIYRGKNKNDNTMALATTYDHDRILSDSINSSILSVLVVGGYIAIFSMVVDVLLDLGIIAFISVPISWLLSICNQPPELAQGIVICFVEITRGCLEISKCGVDFLVALPYVCAMLSFGGMSILLQTSTFLNSCGVKFSYNLLTKFTQAVLSFIITFLICFLVRLI